MWRADGVGGGTTPLSLSLSFKVLMEVETEERCQKPFFWEVDCIHREADEELQTLFTADFTTLEFFCCFFVKHQLPREKESERVKRERERESSVKETKDKQSVHGKDTLVCMEKTNVTDYISICTPPHPHPRSSLLHTPKIKSWKMSWKKKKKTPTSIFLSSVILQSLASND